MMTQRSLHPFRTAPVLSKYGLVLLLLCSFVIAKLYIVHDATHLIKPDNHCALCLSLDSVDDALPPPILVVDNAVFRPVVILPQWLDSYESTVSIPRNRGPPEKNYS